MSIHAPLDFRVLANPSVRHLTPYQPGKPLEELERELGIKNAIKLASNENPLGASPKVILKMQSALQKMHFYPDGHCFELKQALSHFLSIDSQQITVGNGSENILELIVKSYLQKEDTAVISQYAFLTIPIILNSYGIQIKVAPANQFGHSISEMIKAIDEKTRVLFLVNPNNPTGTYTNKNDFLTLMNAIPPHVLVVVDEAYAEYIGSPDYPNTFHYLNHYPNLVITRTFSKAYGLAGLRLGYAVSSVEISDILNRARLPFNVNSLASTAAQFALEDQEHVKKSIQLNQQGMQQVEIELKKLNLPFIPSTCNFITIDVQDAKTVYHQLLLEGVIVRPLHAYDMQKHIRVTIGTAEQNKRFLEALHKIMKT